MYLERRKIILPLNTGIWSFILSLVVISSAFLLLLCLKSKVKDQKCFEVPLPKVASKSRKRRNDKQRTRENSKKVRIGMKSRGTVAPKPVQTTSIGSTRLRNKRSETNKVKPGLRNRKKHDHTTLS